MTRAERHRVAGWAIVVVTAGALACSVSVAVAKSVRVACAAKANRTVVANEHVRVVRARAQIDGVGLYACRNGQRNARWLGDYAADNGPGVTAVRLAGWFVAYDDVVCSKVGPCNGGVRRLDVRRNALQRIPEATPWQPGDALIPVSALLVTARGSLAWIRQRASGAPGVYDVIARPVDGASTSLDSGTAIAPRSLAAAGGRVYWTNAGTPRSAALP